jgi:uncharacterized protein
MIINGRLNYPIKVGGSSIHGQGAFAKVKIPARSKIGYLGGKVISKKEGREKAKSKTSISLVELWNGKTLDASVNSNELRYINHSCSPNTFMRTFNFQVEFYALRDIKPSEELTCNYGETHHNGKRACNCGAAGCVGFI